MTMHTTRRSYLQAVGALALASALAGCTRGTARTPEPTPGHLPTEPAYDGWFNDVRNYRGTRDARGEPAVTVTVGAKDSLGHFSFAPAAVGVSPGTTVTWEWSGNGGTHDVVALDGAFRSPYTDRAGTTFTHTFDTPGVYKYYCTPHRGMGMKGAVVVTA
ncbi:halocyanin domain-containing protein [Halorarius litoreus]|uniref:halocyanin domain-containing protein n=1 Tax=Halorarius litoreus TaxID=2962676 RepID=UPI0020CC159A|nr:halocyanin domain-containing protein [Halorarius litoreus]